MKLIIAMVQPHKLEDVKKSLFDANVHKMTVLPALGAGQQKGYADTYRGIISEVNLLTKTMFIIGVNEDYVKTAIKAITEGAKTGNIGDGKIFILDLEDAIRIRTGEKGTEAIG